jgi:hypothetical protein
MLHHWLLDSLSFPPAIRTGTPVRSAGRPFGWWCISLKGLLTATSINLQSVPNAVEPVIHKLKRSDRIIDA